MSVYATRDWRDRIRLEILDRDGWRCTRCRRGPQELRNGVADLTVDHIRALCDGGGNQPSNLRTLCRRCHGEKTAADRRARARANRRGMRPATDLTG